MNRNTRLATHILTYSFVAFLLAVGLDKALNLERLTDWELLVGPVSTTIFPFSAEVIVRIQGCIEVLLAALIVFSPWKRIALGLFIASTLLVILDLASHRFYILIVRDVFLIAATIALLLLRSPEGKKS
jgi:hypothetical protein